MNTEQINNEKLNSDERRLIANRFNCHPDYVLKLINGERRVVTVTAKNIMKAVEIVKANKEQLIKIINQPDLDSE